MAVQAVPAASPRRFPRARAMHRPQCTPTFAGERRPADPTGVRAAVRDTTRHQESGADRRSRLHVGRRSSHQSRGAAFCSDRLARNGYCRLHTRRYGRPTTRRCVSTGTMNRSRTSCCASSRQAGGQSRVSDDDYLEGAPELIVEIAASSATYDLHDKLRVYRRNGVREYVVWRVHDRQIDWFVLADEEYRRLEPDAAGVDPQHRLSRPAARGRSRSWPAISRPCSPNCDARPRHRRAHGVRRAAAGGVVVHGADPHLLPAFPPAEVSSVSLACAPPSGFRFRCLRRYVTPPCRFVRYASRR